LLALKEGKASGVKRPRKKTQGKRNSEKNRSEGRKRLPVVAEEEDDAPVKGRLADKNGLGERDLRGGSCEEGRKLPGFLRSRPLELYPREKKRESFGGGKERLIKESGGKTAEELREKSFGNGVTCAGTGKTSSRARFKRREPLTRYKELGGSDARKRDSWREISCFYAKEK